MLVRYLSERNLRKKKNKYYCFTNIEIYGRKNKQNVLPAVEKIK